MNSTVNFEIDFDSTEDVTLRRLAPAKARRWLEGRIVTMTKQDANSSSGPVPQGMARPMT
jgi:hypothetical protein